MLEYIIRFSLRNKLIILLFILTVVVTGIYSLLNIPIGAVPDITNNQVQVITTSRNLSTQDVEQFITYPVELEMANLPGVKEIRSVSKFGLSVVTIVFEDRMGTYLPRQLIAEKIKSASEIIPEGFGTPEMGPISTGLGEIYQYVLDVDDAYKERYTPMDLRTIQDWVVKRQLSGIPGVVEVNTWGGFLKQYEVTIDPDRLHSMNLSIGTVYEALESNNSVAGGSYIEKGQQAYFIRGEGLVASLEDIQNIVVAHRNGHPIFIKDIATVGFGHATRFGAITGNGEGEQVLGQVMMLKDANSKEVIEAVKKRVSEIQGTLPPGVSINGFLERSILIDKTTATVVENLVLGCLIVIFVVVLLLGNIRSGLVVASIIPLSLLFALSMMYMFGIDANLMSLGAIDFGIIIDGAVIIVEFIAFQITQKSTQFESLPSGERKELLDSITFDSTKKMMRSAIFGQLIIIIVFIPILSLSNVEGKMFRPMALTFSFALIGAIIFCFTYVPVISSLFLKPSRSNGRSISARLMDFLHRLYEPVLESALKHKRTVLSVSLLLISGAVFLFTRMGGEFVPTLDEGDFVIQPVLKTGTSLSRTVELTTKMEKAILEFPEVEQVITRIGAAEVPTDPMSMEEPDVIITLKDKSEWTTADSKDELANLIKETLTTAIPGADYEITQPIEMRFNELITGVRADLAIKIFGEDLDILYQKALEVENLIQDVPGAADISVEKVVGLPQMKVEYDRDLIAKYGLNIQDVNDVLLMGFAGKTAGSVFEGEKRFDLIVRFTKDFRSDLTSLKNTYVSLPKGGRVPLNQLASISYTHGPAMISRDDTKRRIVIGVNVRGRDLESVAEEVQSLVRASVKFPPGYLVDYGGQFENLQAARARLAIAVPVALALIFIMLQFAFRSFKEAIMVYSAIPLAAVGGVLFLWIRDLPFSISAGVGFIALFGIAVLNGIVLIEHFKELKKQGMTDLKQRILTGTHQRLRPVLLTASAAALGFLPMATSTSTGAEVQRPLATVVIGGLITATILTLVVLPVLYSILDSGKKRLRLRPKQFMWIALLIPFSSFSQEILTRDQAIELARSNNAQLRASGLGIEREEALMGTSFNPDKTNLYYMYDENNIAPNNEALKVWGIEQEFQFPTVYSSQKQVQKSQVSLSKQQFALDEQILLRKVSMAYLNLQFQDQLVVQYEYLDSLYDDFALRATRRFELGESNLLEKISAESQQQRIHLQLAEIQNDRESARIELMKWVQSDMENVPIRTERMIKLLPAFPDSTMAPDLELLERTEDAVALRTELEKSKMWPDLQMGYFQGNNSGNRTYHGFQVGLGIPLMFGSGKSSIQASRVELERIQAASENYRTQYFAKLNRLQAELLKYTQQIEYYDATGSVLARQILQTATRSFESGEIGFFQFMQATDQAIQIEISYLNSLHSYNQTVIQINYLTL
jgi:cobalt-zinc-cadmium resistance protein CzcA